MSTSDIVRPHQWRSVQEPPSANGLYAVRFEDGPEIVVEYRGVWQFAEAAASAMAHPCVAGVIESQRPICWRKL